MKKLNTIFKIINNENIILEEINFNHSYLKGIYFNVPGVPPTIGIQKSIVSYSLIYISELGHHFTTSGNLLDDCNTYSEELQKNKKEKTAKLWAAEFLISDEEFVYALNSCISSINSIADFFNVTDEILNYNILSITLNEFKYIIFKAIEIPYNSCAI